MNANRKTVIGLTGGIATGKTAVANIWRGMFGVGVVFTDEISRSVSKNGGAAYSALAGLFPEAVEGCGEINRKKLRDIVFSDPKKLQALNAATHPAIREEAVRQIRQAAAGVVLVEAPLLFESGFDSLCDTTVCTICEAAIQIRRLCARDGCPPEEAKRIILAQMPQDQKAALCDFVIDTGGTADAIKTAVERIHGEIAGRG